MNFIGDAELANNWEFHREESVCTQYGQKRGEERWTAGTRWKNASLLVVSLMLLGLGLLECGSGKGVHLLEKNSCSANAAIKYLDQDEMTFAHLMMAELCEDQIYVP